MFKFTIKAGVAGTAIYYLAEEGVWRSSTESIQAYEKLNNTVSPYVKELTKDIDIQLPKLPESNQLGYLSKQTWNKGVMYTFEFLSQLPEHVSSLKNRGMDVAMKNPEIKKFVESFNNGKPTTEEVEVAVIGKVKK